MRPLALSLALVLAALSRGEDLKATAQRLLDAQRKASMTKDQAYYERTYAPDFVAVGIRGERTPRAKAIAMRKAFLPFVDLQRDDLRLVNVVPSPGGMVLSVSIHSLGTLHDPRTRQPHRMEVEGSTEETWAKSGGGWKLKIQKVVTYAMKIDGKPVGPRPQAGPRGPKRP